MQAKGVCMTSQKYNYSEHFCVWDVFHDGMPGVLTGTHSDDVTRLFAFVSFELPAMPPSGFAMLFLLVVFSSLLGVVASSSVIEVELTESELDGADRSIPQSFP